MSSPSFRFQQFEVYHDNCAMKVGTDSVLLGAWAQVFFSEKYPEGKGLRMLDVGCGSGVLALMLAQRYPQALVEAVEKDVRAALQAAGNIDRSPWSSNIEVFQGCFPSVMSNVHFCTEEAYHLIVSNPPFFKNDLKSPDKWRSMARHSEDLDFLTLTKGVAPLLHPEGCFSVIIPFQAAEVFEEYAWMQHLYLVRHCEVIPVEGKAPKRVMQSYSKQKQMIERTQLSIQDRLGNHSPEYLRLTQDYYLDRQK